MNVNMYDVTFFAYKTGDAPKIWATDNIAGQYSCTTCGGTTINLDSAQGLAATFTVQQWDTTANKWTATVTNGGGIYSGTGSMKDSTIQFEGAAAGTNSGLAGTGCTVGTDCNFSGTAAGTAQ